MNWNIVIRDYEDIKCKKLYCIWIFDLYIFVLLIIYVFLSWFDLKFIVNDMF